MRRVVLWIVSCLLLVMSSSQAGNVRIIKQDEAYTLIRPFFLHFNTELPCEKYPETQNIDLSERQVQELQYSCHPACLTRLGLAFKPDFLLECIGSNMSTSGEATELFFTHSNHLGSASWITNFKGLPVQYLHYAPYGELLANQTPYGYDERYKFTGKERDAETGYDFFGARYLWSQGGHWLSVDPLASDYPDISPYAYCAWNPIKYVDPDGNEKHNKMDPNTEAIDQCVLFEAALLFPDNDSHIYFFSHGDSEAMYPYGHEGPMTAEDFVAYILESSELWGKTTDKSTLKIVLISCETGKGDNSIAKKISTLLPEVIVVAPNEAIKATGDGESAEVVGVAKSEANTKEEIRSPENMGLWVSFQNGEVIGVSENGGAHIVVR